MNFVFSQIPKPVLPVVGSSDVFPAHRIFCVGRNYAEHAREMGNDPDREPPFFFLKSLDSLAPEGGRVMYPPSTEDLHHEVELVVALGKGGRSIEVADAFECVFGYAVGIDLTRRDLQADAKRLSRPWDFGKSFEQSAPLSSIQPVLPREKHPNAGVISLRVNGEIRQHGDLRDMIWSIPEIISILSNFYMLQPGDLIFTGTPAGVGAVNPGDRLNATVEGFPDLQVDIVGSE